GQNFIAGEQLRALARQAAKYKRLLTVIERKSDSRIVDGIVKFAKLTKASLRDQKALVAALGRMQQYFDQYAPELSDVKLVMAADTEHGGFKISTPARTAGVRKATTIDFEFMDSPEFNDLTAAYADLAVLGDAPYFLENGSDIIEFSRVEELAD